MINISEKVAMRVIHHLLQVPKIDQVSWIISIKNDPWQNVLGHKCLANLVTHQASTLLF